MLLRRCAAGEGNRDGTNDNFSWNCGAEGETGNGGVRALRQRQMRNCMVALMMSQGTPMIVSGEGEGRGGEGRGGEGRLQLPAQTKAKPMRKSEEEGVA